VVVAGDGIAGLAAAAELGRRGMSVHVFERTEEQAESGTALVLQPNGLEVLEGLGVLDGLARSGHRVERAEMRSSTGRRLVEVDFRQAPGCRYALVVRRRALLDILREAADGPVAYGGSRTPPW